MTAEDDEDDCCCCDVDDVGDVVLFWMGRLEFVVLVEGTLRALVGTCPRCDPNLGCCG